jgi:hypothetical protein
MKSEKPEEEKLLASGVLSKNHTTACMIPPISFTLTPHIKICDSFYKKSVPDGAFLKLVYY